VGEIFAWIIGWDLILGALSTATVAVGWSGYFVSLMHNLGINIPRRFSTPAPSIPRRHRSARRGPARHRHQAIRRREHLLVAIKAMVLIVFVVASAAYVSRANLTPFVPPNTGEFGHFGWSGILRGRASCSSPTSLRRSLDGGSGGEEPWTRHADRHPRSC
jgi:APA family basic amino acid/polyamine antiporter